MFAAKVAVEIIIIFKNWGKKRFFQCFASSLPSRDSVNL